MLHHPSRSQEAPVNRLRHRYVEKIEPLDTVGHGQGRIQVAHHLEDRPIVDIEDMLCNRVKTL